MIAIKQTQLIIEIPLILIDFAGDCITNCFRMLDKNDEKMSLLLAIRSTGFHEKLTDGPGMGGGNETLIIIP